MTIFQVHLVLDDGQRTIALVVVAPTNDLPSPMTHTQVTLSCVRRKLSSLQVPCKMGATLLLLLLAANSCLGLDWDFDESVNPEFNYVPKDYDFQQARFLNFSDVGNNSLLTLGAIFVVGVILFGKYFHC